MENYVEINFQDITNEETDILIAKLNELGFEGFEESTNRLAAFIREKDLDEKNLEEVVTKNQLSYSKTIIPPYNWNEEWEKNFQPVFVWDCVLVRAAFHISTPGARHEIIITPKMSFEPVIMQPHI